LWRASREAAVGSDHAVPGEIVNCGQDVADEAWRAGIDVPVGADVALGDRADPLDDVQPPRLAIPVRLRLTRPGHHVADAADRVPVVKPPRWLALTLKGHTLSSSSFPGLSRLVAMKMNGLSWHLRESTGDLHT